MMKVALISTLFLAASPIFANGFLESVTSQLIEFVFSKIFDAGYSPLESLFKEDQNELQNIEKHLQELITKFDNFSTDFKNSIESLKDHISVENRGSKIQDLQNKIEAKFTSTKEYMAHVQNLENTTLQEMMQSLSDGEDSIDNLVHLFHLKIFGSDSGIISNCESLEDLDNSRLPIDYYAIIPDDNNDRRYQYVWYRKPVISRSYDTRSVKETIFGNGTSHNSGISLDTWLRGFVNCDACYCQCDDPDDEKSVRSFSLTPLNSDTDKNMVITGVQVAVQGKAFVFKITQAHLNPLGRVNGSVSVKMNEPSPNDRFFKVLHDKRKVYMGKAELDIEKMPDYVATGIHFAEKNGNLALKVRFTKFNYTSGQLYDANKRKNTKIFSNALSENFIKQEENGKCPDAYHDNKPSETKTGKIEFRRTTLKEDVGQRTVPFLDLQEVKSTEMALSGIGLQFRSRKDSGGFISPIVVTYPSFLGIEGAALLQ